jgi:hypothetical protein
MKSILFLAAVYSLIINQCYQKNTAEASIPPKETSAFSTSNARDTTDKASTEFLLYSLPEDRTDVNTLNMPQYSVVGSAVKTY